MLPWIFKKALERDAKFNDAGRNEDFASVFNVGVLVHGKVPLVDKIMSSLSIFQRFSNMQGAMTKL
ncbi:hypothetical protein ACYH5O_004008 [Escherichia coli]|uniref:hypothetical protein n=1 Tax=Escherichia coli TaxID=562 RepID=UPI0010B9E038|nr:hypothetical protein [Escherichia coli]GCJ56676.1 hypothetical protein BvCmsL71A_00178 [Escherichia coli]